MRSGRGGETRSASGASSTTAIRPWYYVIQTPRRRGWALLSEGWAMSEAPTTYTHVWEEQADDFSSLDAALWEWCAVTYGTSLATARRIPRTSASIRYRLAQGDDEVMSIVLRQLAPGHFLMRIDVVPGFAEEIQRVGRHPRHIIGEFFKWRAQDLARPRSDEIDDPGGGELLKFQAVPGVRRGGRSSWPEDLKAREQYTAGADRETVFQEWSKHLSRKRKRPADLRDTFRKVVIERTKPEE
jgi:hypothetical protein